MARLNIRANLSSRSLWTFYLLLLLWLWICSQDAVSHSTVQFLPGFQGTLPFELETGYVGVDESEDVQVFYYFIKSEANPKEDPLLLWLTGGPGCSSFSALVFEIGPLHFQIVEYNGSLPNLELNPHSWTKASSIIFADLPVGTGFSYARKPQASHSGDFKTSQHAHMFMRKWLIDHPEFMSNPFYVGGGSYSGMTLPIAVQYMSNGKIEKYWWMYEKFRQDFHNDKLQFDYRVMFFKIFDSLSLSECKSKIKLTRNSITYKYI